MAKTFTCPFAQTPRTGTAVVTAAAANITSDAPTNLSLIATAGPDGAIVTRVWAIPRGTVSASSLILCIAGADGAVRVIDSEAMPSFAASTSAALPETQFASYSEATPIRLAAGDKLYVGSQVANAQGICFRIEWTDF